MLTLTVSASGTLEVLDAQGKSLGHVVDFIRNGSDLMLNNVAELKGQLDRAWIDREAQQRDVVRIKDAALSAVLEAHADDATDVTLSADLAANVEAAKAIR